MAGLQIINLNSLRGRLCAAVIGPDYHIHGLDKAVLDLSKAVVQARLQQDWQRHQHTGEGNRQLLRASLVRRLPEAVTSHVAIDMRYLPKRVWKLNVGSVAP
jgi:hypothetical protein